MSKYYNYSFFRHTLAFSHRCLLLFTVAATFSLSKASAASLTIGDNLVLRDVDDKTIEQSFFTKKETIELTSGAHSLVIKYKDVFEDMQLGEEVVIKSDYFVVKFIVEGSEALVLKTSEINNLAAAERFIKSPELSMVSQDNKEHVLVLQTLSDYEIAKQVTNVVTTLTGTKGVSPNTSQAYVSATQSTSIPIDSNTVDPIINEVDAIPMLKYWWKKASKEQQATFLQLVTEKTQLEK